MFDQISALRKSMRFFRITWKINKSGHMNSHRKKKYSIDFPENGHASSTQLSGSGPGWRSCGPDHVPPAGGTG